MSHSPYQVQMTFTSANDRLKTIMQAMTVHQQQGAALVDNFALLVQDASRLQQEYDQLLQEKQALADQKARAEERLNKIRKLATTFDVEDAVAASDGFMYPREHISRYICNCQAENRTPHSQQTNEPITSLLVPNRSLKGFIDRVLETCNAKKPAPGGGSGGGGGASANGKVNARSREAPETTIEVNDKGDRLHPCTRVYGFCNYKDGCTYSGYPYNACLSHLKGKCRFGDQCHEEHVEFRGPLNKHGEPEKPQAQADGTTTEKKEKVKDKDKDKDKEKDKEKEKEVAPDAKSKDAKAKDTAAPAPIDAAATAAAAEA